MRPLPDTIKNVIWIQTGFLGDIIIQTAAISVLRRQRPDIKQILITTGLGVSALRGHSELAGLICFDKRGPIMDSFRNVRSEVRELIQVPRETMILQAHRSFPVIPSCSLLRLLHSDLLRDPVVLLESDALPKSGGPARSS